MDVLHELIASLSVAEKSYFKRYAAKLSDEASSTHYIQLFDAISAQKDYDEAQLKRKFAREKFVKQFSVAKNYLYKAIIKALRNFYEEANPQQQVKHLLLELNILMDKGIYEQAYKVIQKGILIAEEYELFSDENEFLSKELYLLMNSYRQQQEGRTVETIVDAQRHLTRRMENLVEYESLYQQQHTLVTGNYQMRSEEQLNKANEVIVHSLLRRTENALSAQAKYYHFYIHALHCSVIDKRKEFLNSARLLVAHCRSSKRYYGLDLRSYMNALNLLLEACYFNAAWKDMKIALDELQMLPAKSDRDKTARFIYYSRFGLIYMDMMKDTKGKRLLIEEAWQTVRKLEQRIPFHIRISLLVTFSSALMEMGEYAKALDWISLYTQKKKSDESRYDVQSILLMMQLISHYELGDLLLVKNIVPNIARFIRKVGQQSNFEKVALSFFAKITSSKEVTTKVFEETLRELNALKEGDILHRNRTLHDIFRMFIESKKLGKKYHEMLNI